jgi:hypothetical protein
MVSFNRKLTLFVKMTKSSTNAQSVEHGLCSQKGVQPADDSNASSV